MIDCPNGEIRDQLPDYLHDQLPATVRARVSAHVATCVACSAELALLIELRGSMHAVPVVDVEKVVAALPSPGASRASWRAAVPSRWRPLDWRIAASIAVLAVSSGAAAILSRGSDRERPSDTVALSAVGVPQVGTTALDAYLSDATALELEALLDDLESFDGLPAGEPDAALPTPGGAEEEGL
jgi:anti-sigma factor RsiW